MKTENHTHPVPSNPLGYFAHHTDDNVPIDGATLKQMLDGPLTVMQPKLTAELASQNYMAAMPNEKS
jgi:hypothetical protein